MELIMPKGYRQKSETGPMLLGTDLQDAREEIFCRMVCDGLALGVSFNRAGFKSTNVNAASNLWQLPRIQERAQAILEARRTTGVMSLGEVTDMLKRVFSGAYNAEEYSAAHNAAFSLARLFGHVTDRATLEVIRRPSRDPDAPSEQALGDWVASLPALNGPGPGPVEPGLNSGPDSLNSALQGPPASLLGGPGPEPLGPEPSMHVDVHRNQSELPNNINGLEEFRTLTCIGTGPQMHVDVHRNPPGRPENGAPTGPVTVTPTSGGLSGLLGPEPSDKYANLLGNEGTRSPGGSAKGAPVHQRQVPAPTGRIDTKGEFPPIEDLF